MAYTTIDDPSAYFQNVLWTGDGSAGNAVTFDGNSDMQPDFVWSKRRDVGYGHVLKDTSRGGTSNNDVHLVSNTTAGDSTYTAYRMDFNSDGFTLDGSGDSGFQANGTSMVSWSWKANGGTTSTNTDGSTNTTVQANTDAGFSIVTFTTDGGNETYGHGLGVKPDVVLVKSRSGAGTWIFTTDVIDGSVDYLILNATNAAADLSYGAFTSSTFQYNDNNAVTQVAYCFAEKQGYSKFGKYVGNGNVNGPFVYTGFQPAWILLKRTDSTSGGNWHIIDNKRSASGGANVNVYTLFPNLDAAESTGEAASTYGVDFLSNGFKIRASHSTRNASGGSYIYMAFAENPFTTSTGIPTTAR